MSYPLSKEQNMAIVWLIHEEDPYAGTSQEFTEDTLDAAANRVDDLTGAGADVILADISEADALPWEWTDPEDGREVSLHREEVKAPAPRRGPDGQTRTA
jgi:hypothetical protein